MRQLRGCIFTLSLLVLAGCASAPKQEGNRFSQLNGGSPALFATELPVESMEEAVARGDAEWEAGKADHAVYYYVRALEYKSDDPATFYKIGIIHLGKGDVPRAELAFRLALERKIDHAGAAEALGLIMLRRRDYGEAQALLESAVTHDARRYEAEAGLAALADLRGDFGRAERYYRSALAKQPNSARIENNFGYSRYLAGDWGGAETHYRRAVQLDPRYRQAWQNLGQLKVRRGDPEGAVDTFAQVLSKAEAENNVGYLSMVGGDYVTAEHYFRRAVRHSPTYYPAAERNLEQLQRLRSAAGGGATVINTAGQ